MTPDLESREISDLNQIFKLFPPRVFLVVISTNCPKNGPFCYTRPRILAPYYTTSSVKVLYCTVCQHNRQPQTINHRNGGTGHRTRCGLIRRQQEDKARGSPDEFGYCRPSATPYYGLCKTFYLGRASCHEIQYFCLLNSPNSSDGF